MSPVGLAIFFTFMTLAEGGNQKALKRKFAEVQKPQIPISSLDPRLKDASCLEIAPR